MPFALVNQSAPNSFDCDSTALDSLLGWTPDSRLHLRVDRAESLPSSHLARRPAQVFAPLEVVPAAPVPIARGSVCVELDSPADAELRRTRLVRLLDQQQSWYDAQQQAASAAEQLLTLCEHHQQQWLLPHPPTLASRPPQT